MLFVETHVFTRLVTATLNDVVYYWRAAEDQIYLLYLFSKNARTDLTQAQLRQLAEAARALK